MKLPGDRPGSVEFRICEAAVRGLQRSATSGLQELAALRNQHFDG